MPVFYIDFQNGGEIFKDEVGSELCSLQEAQSEAIKALEEFTRNIFMPGEERQLVVDIRDEAGFTLYRATLHFRDEVA